MEKVKNILTQKNLIKLLGIFLNLSDYILNDAIIFFPYINLISIIKRNYYDYYHFYGFLYQICSASLFDLLDFV